MPANSGLGRSLPIPQQTNAGDIFVRQTSSRNDISIFDALAWRGLITSDYAVFQGPVPWADVTHPAYGADPTGVADSLAAFQAAAAALSLVSGTRGGVILVPPGIYRLSNTFKLPDRTILRGYGRQTEIRPTVAGFPATTPLIRIGSGTNTLVSNCRLEELYINCQSVAADGVVTNEASEQSGMRNVLIANYTRYGIHYQANISGAGHCDFWDLELLPDPAATGTIGFYGDSFGNALSLRRVSVVPYSPSVAQADGIRLVGGSPITGGPVYLESIHCELANIGVHFGPDSFGSLIGFDGQSTLTYCVEIDSGAGTVTLMNIAREAATHTINDLQQNIVVDDQEVALWIASYPGSLVSASGIALGGRVLTPSLFVPSVTAESGTSPPAAVLATHSTDQHGIITWGTGSGAQNVQQVFIQYSVAFQNNPTVSLTPLNAATAALQPYVGLGANSGWYIYTVSLPAASQANTTYACSYHVDASS